MLIKNPNWNCNNCYSKWEEGNWAETLKPPCQTKKGCPAGDLCRDIELDRQANAFLSYKLLQQAGTIEAVLLKALSKAGLSPDDTDAIATLEVIYSKYRNRELEKSSRKRRKK